MAGARRASGYFRRRALLSNRAAGPGPPHKVHPGRTIYWSPGATVAREPRSWHTGGIRGHEPSAQGSGGGIVVSKIRSQPMATAASESLDASTAYRLNIGELFAGLATDEHRGAERSRSAITTHPLRAERACRRETRPPMATFPLAVSGCARHPTPRRDRCFRGAL